MSGITGSVSDNSFGDNTSAMGAGGNETVRQLNSFLRGEISAAETYRIALDKVSSGEPIDANLGLLHEIQREHGRAAQAIRDRIHELGGEAADSSGAWGIWAKITVETASLFGDKSALKSLKEGEEHGLRDFRDGLKDVDPASSDLVQNQLIPAQERHIDLLDQMINSAGQA